MPHPPHAPVALARYLSLAGMLFVFAATPLAAAQEDSVPTVARAAKAVAEPASPREDDPERIYSEKWTPRRNIGQENVPHESAADWVDARIRKMDTGPFYSAAIVVPPAGEAPPKPTDTRDAPRNPNMVTDALAIRLGGEKGVPLSGVLFDKQTMVLRSGWTGGFLSHSDRRFGLLTMPVPAEPSDWWVPRDARWMVGPSEDAKAADVEYKGLYLNGEQVVLSYTVAGTEVLESVSMKKSEVGTPIFVRTFEFGPNSQRLELPLVAWPGAGATTETWLLETPSEEVWHSVVAFHQESELISISSIKTDPEDGIQTSLRLSSHGGWQCVLRVPPSQDRRQLAIAIWRGPEEKYEENEETLKVFQSLAPTTSLSEVAHDSTPAPRWGKPLHTQGKVGNPQPGAPFAVDTITIPYKNRYNALFFLTGVAFAPDGACYVTAAHGDVWKVTGIDDDLDKITWQRFATGLFQPLGIVIRNGDIFVLGRSQITRLHDVNDDGEADFYESFNNDLTDKGQPHAFAMCLEMDADGNFYFLKSGARNTKHGASLIKVSADGETMTRYARGFRNANGLSVGPNGTITAADNEGNWVPATRLDFVEKGEFCGFVPGDHRPGIPEGPGKPVCWLPHVIDNSAGGQVWIPEGHWGPLAGGLIHLSWGLCTAYYIPTEKVNGVWQGGAVRLPLEPFLSGVCRGRFRMEGKGADGHLYLCGLDGWSTTAAKDGCLQRVRYLGNPVGIMTELHVYENGLELVFPEPLDRELATQADRYGVSVWNYRWTKNYGSDTYSVAHPSEKGRDQLKVTDAKVSSDGRRVFITVEGLQPVMQLRVQAGLLSAQGGRKIVVDYYGTIHELRPAKAVATRTADR